MLRKNFWGDPTPDTGLWRVAKRATVCLGAWYVEVICSVTNITLSANEVMVLSRFVYLPANGMWVDFDGGVNLLSLETVTCTIQAEWVGITWVDVHKSVGASLVLIAAEQ